VFAVGHAGEPVEPVRPDGLERAGVERAVASERHGGKGSLQSDDRRLCGARWHLTGVTRMGTDMQEMVDVAFSQRDGLRDWHGLEMDACERMPAGSMAKAWHNDMPFVKETWRGC